MAVQSRVVKFFEAEHAGVFGLTVPKPRKQPSTKSALVFQFKITLIDIHPPIWRRIQVPDCTSATLHEYIQRAFGWENCHRHQFEIDRTHYRTPMPAGYAADVLQFEDESQTTLSEVLLTKSRKKVRWLYEYDFGDGWKHEIVFEGNTTNDSTVKSPVCLDGERAGPPEDCGGAWGYDDFLAAISDRRHPRHRERREWVGEFDPEAFDLKAATEQMRKVTG